MHKIWSFTIKSGTKSPYYIDLARLLSAPKQLNIIAQAAAETIKTLSAQEKVDKLASIELKGALIVPSIGIQIDLPCVIVRKEEKAYGIKGRIAGADVNEGDNLLFFDDVVSEGLSKIEGLKPLQELGANIKHILVVVNREQGGVENLEKLGYKVHALAKVSQVVEALAKTHRITNEQAQTVLDYIKK
jgi:orotate phosphoribosyltransferase